MTSRSSAAGVSGKVDSKSAAPKVTGIRKPPSLRKLSDQPHLRSAKRSTASVAVKSQAPSSGSGEKRASQSSMTKRPGGAVRKPAEHSTKLAEVTTEKSTVNPSDDATVASSHSPGVLEFKPYFQELDIIIEYKLVCHFLKRDGVYVVPSLKSGRVWHGLICLHAGPFRGGLFRFNVFFPDRFPSEPPMVKFVSRVFHPQVDGNGVLNVAQAFPNWRAQHDHVWQVLSYMKKVFCSLDTWQPLNEKATVAVHESMDAYNAQAQTCVHEALLDLVDIDGHSDDDGNFLKYFNISDEAQAEVKEQMGSQSTFNAVQHGGSDLVLLSQRFVKSFREHIAAARAMPAVESAAHAKSTTSKSAMSKASQSSTATSSSSARKSRTPTRSATASRPKKKAPGSVATANGGGSSTVAI